jgi:hypothetical protein
VNGRLLALLLWMAACTRDVVVHRAAQCPKPSVVEDSTAQVDSSSDAGASAGTDLAGPADAPPPAVAPPVPMTATGSFVAVGNALPPMSMDAGKKGQTLPHDAAGLFVDADLDGDLDLVATDGQQQVWLGLAVKPFTWQFSLLGKQDEVGITTLAAIDVDGDGQPEIAASGARLHLWVRQTDGSWQDQAGTRGLTDPVKQSLQGMVVADIDRDGLLDLLVTRFACSTKSALLVFVNQGDGTFAEQGAELGLKGDSTYWNTLVTDVDGDRRADVLALTEGCEPMGGNAWFRDRGDGMSPRFERKVLLPAFLASGQGNGSPMGGAVADWNGDGLLDIALSGVGLRVLRMRGVDVTKLTPAKVGNADTECTMLLQRQPGGGLVNVTVPAGLAAPLSVTGQTMVSWTTRPLDIDFDGRLDLLVTHGHDFLSFNLADDGGARPVLFRNQGNGTFADLSITFGLPELHLGRAAVMADLDDDGDLDLLLGGETHPMLLLRNDVQHGGKALRVRLRGQLSNRWGLGARLRLYTSAGTRVAELNVHAPAHTQDLPEAWFALPPGEQPKKLEVAWPDGYDQEVALASDASEVMVQEPPLVVLDGRTVGHDQLVTLTTRGHGKDGTPDGSAIAIELQPGAAGTWQGPTVCDGQGACSRTWRSPAQGSGRAALALSHPSLTFTVQPVLRWR